MKQKILVVDDDQSIRFTFREILEEEGYQVETADNLSSCIKKMQADAYALVLLDVGLGLDNGIEAIEHLKIMQPDCIITTVTGNPELRSLVEAKNKGAFDYLAKPVRQASLLYNVQKALEKKVSTH